MDLPATSGAGAPDAPLLPTDHEAAAGLLQAYEATQAPEPTEPEEPQDLNNAAVEGAEEVTEEGADGPTEAAAKPDAEADKPKKEETEGQSLEEFFAEHGQEPFLNLKFKTKVDGREEEATLSDLIRDRQLAQASYARMNEAAQARQQFQTEREQVRQALGVQIKQAQQLNELAQNQLLQDFQRVDWNHLRANDPANYSALYTDFQARNAAIQQTREQIAAAERTNAQAADTQRQQAIASERERLFQARPDWRDPAKANAAYQAIAAMGRKLGFTDADLTAISDHRMLLGLHQLAELSAQAQKQQAALPKVLKRVRAAPKMAAPGTRQAAAPKGAANPKLEEAWLAGGGRNDRLGAAVFERFVT